MSGELTTDSSMGKKIAPEVPVGSDFVATGDARGGMTDAGEGDGLVARPVRVDEAGRIFELSGDPIVVPGLSPVNILKGIEDERAGRLRTLDAYVTSREQNGV